MHLVGFSLHGLILIHFQMDPTSNPRLRFSSHMTAFQPIVLWCCIENFYALNVPVSPVIYLISFVYGLEQASSHAVFIL